MIRTIAQFINYEGKEQMISAESLKAQAYLQNNARQIIRILTMDDDDILYDQNHIPRSPEENLMHILDMNILDTQYPN